MDKSTTDLVGPEVHLEAQPAVTLKGYAEPVPVYLADAGLPGERAEEDTF